MDDRAIIALYNARDEQAIAETANKYGAHCLAIAENILHSLSDSEECVNDTWLNTWNSIPPASPNSLRAWLSRITRNLALNRLSARSADKRAGEHYTTALEELSECIASPTDTESEVLRREEAEELAKSLNCFLQTLPHKRSGHFPRSLLLPLLCKRDRPSAGDEGELRPQRSLPYPREAPHPSEKGGL